MKKKWTYIFFTSVVVNIFYEFHLKHNAVKYIIEKRVKRIKRSKDLVDVFQ